MQRDLLRIGIINLNKLLNGDLAKPKSLHSAIANPCDEASFWRRLSSGAEKWGTYENGNFQWNLIIKPEPSFRAGLEVGSNIPRFDARIGLGNQYINPFTNQIGGKNIGTHLPLEMRYY